MTKLDWFPVLWVGVILSIAGCEQAEAVKDTVAHAQMPIPSLIPSEVAPASLTEPVCLVELLDLSESILEEDHKRWNLERRKILAGVRASRWTIFGIHERSSEAAPLHQVSIDWSNEPVGLAERAKVAKERRAKKQAALKAFLQSYESRTPAKATDIIGALERVQAACMEEPAEVVVYSDMLHAAPKLNLEREVINDSSITRLVRKALRVYETPAGMLNGSRVQVVLTGASSPDTPRVNDHRALERFWRGLLKLLGARVTRFENFVAD